MKRHLINLVTLLAMIMTLSLCSSTVFAKTTGSFYKSADEKQTKVDLRIGAKEYYGISGGTDVIVDSLDISDITVLVQDGKDIEGMSDTWSMSTKFLDSQGRGVLEVQTFEEGKDYIIINLQSHYADCPGAKDVEDFNIMLIKLQLKGEDVPTVTPSPAPSAVPSAAPSVTPSETPADTVEPQKPEKIKKIKLTNKKKKSLTVEFSKSKNAKKYMIQCSTNKKFNKDVKSKKISKTSYTFGKLTTGKVYYVRVKAYNGKLSSDWTKPKKLKISK